MNKKRLMAGAAALVVGAVGVAGLQGLANAYGPTSTTIPGSLFLNNTAGSTTATTNNTFTDTITFTQTPTNPNAGDSVAISLSGANGPSTGPVGVSANGTVIRAKISLTGAQTATIETASYNNPTTGAAGTAACTYPASSIGTSSPEGPWATYGQYTAAGNGSAAIALNQLLFDDQGDGFAVTGSGPCAGTTNNADYYVSAVTQTAGSSQPGLAKTAPQDSTVVKNTFTITGPNASVTFIGGAVTGVTAYTRGSSGDVRASTKNTAVGTVNLAGTVWGANKVSSDFTVELCNTSGSSCDTANSTNGKVLSTDGSGVLSGRVAILTSNTTGARAIKLTEGSNSSLTPITILGSATAAVSPANGGPGTVVSLTGTNSMPSSRLVASAQIANVGFYGLSDGTGGSPQCTGFGAPAQAGALQCTAVGPYIRGSVNQYVSPLPTTNSNSSVGPISVTVADSNTTLVGWAEKSVLCNSSGSSCAPTNTTVDLTSLVGQAGAASAAFTVNQDRCVAYTGDSTGGAGCVTKQNVNVSVLQGNLTQRAYVNTTATTGSTDQSAVSSPVVGTTNVNSDATTINLGTVTTPLAPKTIVGTLNDITVTDNRGGTNGWTLSATAVNFTGTPSGTISNGALSATPSCAAADATNAWDYSNASKVAISGFDATLNAGGNTAGSASQAFSGTVNLCTKDTTTNVTTGSTGGVYNIGGTVTLVVPAFQKAARYVSTITITLA